MISYSHRDKEFVEKLYNCLLAEGFSPGDIWVDWEGIPISAEMDGGDHQGHPEIRCISLCDQSRLVKSPVCQQEIDLAGKSNKRFIPIEYRPLSEDKDAHSKIYAHQYLAIQNEEDLDKNIPVLVKAINTDLDWLAQHTRLYNRALEWESKGYNESYLVRGPDLQDALTFISNGAAGKKPAPLLICISSMSRPRQNYATAVRRRNRLLTVVVGVALALLAVSAFIGWGKSAQNLNFAITEQARAEGGEANAQGTGAGGPGQCTGGPGKCEDRPGK